MASLSKHLLQLGEIAVIPTDTVYGVVARLEDPKAVARLYALKQRERKPGTVVAATIEQLESLGMRQQDLLKVKDFWPAALSVIVPCDDTLLYVHQGVGSLAVRIPDDEALLVLLKETGPLLTSSANQPGKPPATTVLEAQAYFGDDVSWYQDGGYIFRDPSTVVRVIDDKIEVIREGAVTFNPDK
jgi:tRNA threonylcarbamoyl adenosine modification protein (Sua5/YciO/YrdC/YwlC family)